MFAIVMKISGPRLLGCLVTLCDGCSDCVCCCLCGT